VSSPTIGGGGSCGIGGLGHYFSSRFLKMTGKPPPGAHAGAFKKQEVQTGLSGTAN
jgi:hypothetical protein